MPWLWLIVGGIFEVGFTTSLRFVDGFRNLRRFFDQFWSEALAAFKKKAEKK